MILDPWVAERVAFGVAERGGGAGRQWGVVGLSGSVVSWRALAFGCGWAHRTGSALAIVHVQLPTMLGSVDGCVATMAQACRDEWAEELGREVGLWMGGQPIEFNFQSVVGTPARALERIATAREAIAVILGCPKRRLLRRAVSTRLSQDTRRIVIAVP